MITIIEDTIGLSLGVLFQRLSDGLRDRRGGGQVRPLGPESVLVCCVRHRVDMAIISRVRVGSRRLCPVDRLAYFLSFNAWNGKFKFISNVFLGIVATNAVFFFSHIFHVLS